jgi:glycosyltransferase involved in cell wall biosynthesis
MNQLPLIVHTDWSCAWGGQEIRTITELGEMKKLGFRTALFVRPGAELARRAEAEGVPVYLIDFSSKFKLSAWLKLFALIRRLKPAVVNTHSSEDSWVAGCVARLCGVPLVIRTRHVLAPVSSSVSYNLFPHVIWACSESIREKLVAQGVREEKIIVQSTGIDEQRFCFSMDDRLKIREKYGIGEDDILVGNISFLRKDKGHDFIIRTAATMKKDKRFKFIFVGDGGARLEFEEKIKSVDMADRIILTGHREDPEKFFSAIDIVFFASYEETEGISQSFVQGLLCGIPLLTTRSPSLMEPLGLVDKFVTVHYDDIEGAKKGLLKLAGGLDRDEMQIDKQREGIAGKYGLRAMVKNIIRVYGEHGIR